MMKFLLAFATRFLILCLILMALAVVIGRLTHRDIIAYIGVQNNQSDIYLMDLASSLRLNLTRDPAEEYNVIWSPDGTSIAFFSHREQGTGIYRIPMTGGESVRLTNIYGDNEPLFISDWTSEGILVTALSETSSPANYTIYLMDTNGQNVQTLLSDAATNFAPVWSPDRSRVAFLSDRDAIGKALRLYLLNIKDSDVRPANCGEMHPEIHPNDQLTWSPDGTRIAFSAFNEAAGGQHIFICDLATGRVDQLTTQFGQFNITPAWSLDGEQIVFASFFGGTPPTIYIMRADGSDLRLLVENGFYPAWRP